MGRNELVSAIDAKKNLLALDEAKRRLVQLENDMKSRAASSKASLAVQEERRNRSRLTMMQAQQNIDNMRVKAPMSGLFSVKENWDSAGGFFFGQTLPEYRVGDLISSGRTIAEVLEVDKMEILAKVNENDRGNLNVDQPVEVMLDTMPGEPLRGKVKTVAQLASRERFGGSGGTRKFDATFALNQPSAQLRPGVTAQVIIVGDQVKDALYLPRQALFEKDGKTVVYVKTNKGFEPREVKIKHRTESHVAVEGLSENAEVALVNPDKDSKKPQKQAAPSGPMVSGGMS